MEYILRMLLIHKNITYPFHILNMDTHIYIIIPRDESLMPYGSKQCSIGNDVLDLVFCHESVEISKSSCQIFVYQG